MRENPEDSRWRREGKASGAEDKGEDRGRQRRGRSRGEERYIIYVTIVCTCTLHTGGKYMKKEQNKEKENKGSRNSARVEGGIQSTGPTAPAPGPKGVTSQGLTDRPSLERRDERGEMT